MLPELRAPLGKEGTGRRGRGGMPSRGATQVAIVRLLDQKGDRAWE